VNINTYKMARMHSGGHGMSSSALPYKRKVPKWVTMTPTQVTELIVKLAKKGIHSS
jgi:small subunit ribosomal protein S13e